MTPSTHAVLLLMLLAQAVAALQPAKRDVELDKGHIAMIVVFCVLGTAVVLAMLWRVVLVRPVGICWPQWRRWKRTPVNRRDGESPLKGFWGGSCTSSGGV